MRCAIVAFLILLPACRALAQADTAPADAAQYERLVSALLDTRARRDAAVEEMKRQLKVLSDPKNPTANDAAKRDLLIKRREADLAYEAARIAFELYWLERSLTPAQRKEYQEIDPIDRPSLLEIRTAGHRLGVPLPPRQIKAAPIDNVIEWIAAETDIRIVADWRELAAIGMQRRTPVSIDIGRYTRPAAQTLADLVAAQTGGKGIVEVLPHAVIVTTAEGQKHRAELDKKLARRALDIRSWDDYADPFEPVLLQDVPLAEALEAGIPAGRFPPLFVDWRSLEAVGVTPKTPVALLIGVHTIGHRLAVLADAMDEFPKVKEARGIRFDIHPTGQIILSTHEGFGRTTAAVNRLMNAARTEEDRALLVRRLPEFSMQNIGLEDALDFLRDVTRAELHPDWASLEKCGLTRSTPIVTRMSNVPLAFVLATITESPAGKPPVEWEMTDGKLTLKGP